MRINYNQKQDTLYIRFSEEPYQESDEVKEGIILDSGINGEIRGLEVLEASQKFSQEFLNAVLSKKVTLELAFA